ncbi:unnamed protein product [Boreogadus saida]
MKSNDLADFNPGPAAPHPGKQSMFRPVSGISPSRTQFFKRRVSRYTVELMSLWRTRGSGQHHSDWRVCDLESPVHSVPGGSPVNTSLPDVPQVQILMKASTRVPSLVLSLQLSWLAVRVILLSSATSSTESPPPTNHHLLLPLVYAGPPLLLMVLLGIVGGCCWRRSRKEAEEAAPEDEVHAEYVVQNKTKKKERDRSDCETTCSYGRKSATPAHQNTRSTSLQSPGFQQIVAVCCGQKMLTIVAP